MSAKINDGGPAFPRYAEYDPSWVRIHDGAEGMTLRDWFAGMALQGFASESGRYDSKGAAVDAYAWADAMIAAREEKE